jgi:hypothetical protein
VHHAQISNLQHGPNLRGGLNLWRSLNLLGGLNVRRSWDRRGGLGLENGVGHVRS